ncbi:hypothetical protein PHYBOEH_011690 [Phytophthora boehmeriae]|uniref:Uncharacterized protein n=1 Tax=Phytophthora boehmeriae TaxID=109152 RepID=A0A8T1WZ35_9STRA|nr:hypothetical protein PHYBOEH_011690 [Phytophthora boehmeriae]
MPDNFADKVQRNANEMLKAQVHEREKHAAALFESLEKERSAWKQEQHLQQLQWKRRFAEMEKARMDELEEEWARREEERSALLRSAQEEYQRLEQTLRKSLADLEMRERRLAVAEAALQREQEAKRDETEYLHRRLKSEQAHTLSLTKKQTEAYERRVSLLETQLADAENRAKQVEADFAEYRQQQRKVPESKLREEIAALKGNVAELEKQKMVQERACEIAEANVDKMKLQLEQMAAAVKEEKKKHEARVVDELEKLRVKYIAREEKYVLDGDRDELRAIKKQLDDLKGISFRRGGRNSRSNGHHRSRQSVSPQPRQAHTRHHQANLTRRTLSAMQRYNHAASSSSFDQGSDDEIYWEGLSVIGGANEDISVQNNPAAPHDSPGFRTVREAFIVKADLSEPITPPPQYDGPGDSELERLTRERKLLLASGAYDTESYLVQELDRLISITRANIEH